MTITRRLNDLERALGDDEGCPRCGAPGRSYRPLTPPDDKTVGGCCTRCRRLIDIDGRPLDYAVLIVGGAVVMNDDGALTWREDGGPVRVPDGALKILRADDMALLGPARP